MKGKKPTGGGRLFEFGDMVHPQKILDLMQTEMNNGEIEGFVVAIKYTDKQTRSAISTMGTEWICLLVEILNKERMRILRKEE